MDNRFVICLLLLLAFIASGVNAATSGTVQLAVTSYSVDPGYLISGDTGTITVTVKNTGDSSASIHSAALESPCSGFKILSDTAYNTGGALGSGDSTTFTFTFRADVSDGTYYPKFYLDLTDGGAYRMYIPVTVKSTDLSVAASTLPDSFNEGVKALINITIGNPRQNEVTGITVTPVEDGTTITPETAFVGSLSPDSSKDIEFEITPSKETNVTFIVTYHNGVNDHTKTLTLPIRFSEDKQGAKLVLNDVAITSGSGYYTLTGDVNNGGLSSAYSVTVTTSSPVTPVDPYKAYVIGELKMDDFASFTVTYTGSDSSAIPVIITYKDADGNTFTKTVDVDLNAGGVSSVSGVSGSSGSSSGSSSGAPSGGPGGGGMSLFGMGGRMGGSSASGLSSIPFEQIGIILVVIFVIVIVAWKKGYIRQLKEYIPRRKQSEDDDDQSDR